jgi:hypothetical protein
VDRVNIFRMIREPKSQIEPGGFGFRGNTGLLSRGGGSSTCGRGPMTITKPDGGFADRSSAHVPRCAATGLHHTSRFVSEQHDEHRRLLHDHFHPGPRPTYHLPAQTRHFRSSPSGAPGASHVGHSRCRAAPAEAARRRGLPRRLRTLPNLEMRSRLRIRAEPDRAAPMPGSSTFTRTGHLGRYFHIVRGVQSSKAFLLLTALSSTGALGRERRSAHARQNSTRIRPGR